MSRLGRNFRRGGAKQPTSIQRAINVLRKFGTDAHVWIPGVGSINGLTAANYLLSDASTGLAPVDRYVGRASDALGGLGVELVTNQGPFTTSVSSQDNQVANLTNDATYLITYTASASGIANILLYANGKAAVVSCLAGTNTVQVAATTVTASSTDVIRISGTGVGTVSLSSVREVTGIHLVQGTTANKPKLVRGAVNQLTYSKDFTNAAWAKTDTTPTSGQADPFGGMSGTLLTQGSAGTASVSQPRACVASMSQTDTWYLKRGNTDWVRLINATLNGDGAVVFLNLATGVASSVSYAGLGSSGSVSAPVDVGNGYWKISLTCTPNGVGTTKNSLVMAVTGTGSTTRVSGGTYIAGAAQSEIGPVASAYSPTTTAAASNPNAGPVAWQFGGDGVANDYLQLSSVPFQMSDDHWVVVACKSLSYAATAYIFANSSSSAAARCAAVYTASTTGAINIMWRDDASVAASLSFPASAIGETFVVSGKRSGADITGRKNGGSGQTGSVAALGTTSIGRCDAGAVFGSSSYFNGNIYCVICGKGTISDADLLLLERLAASFAGITI